MHFIGFCVLLLLLLAQGASSQRTKTEMYLFIEDGIECRSTNAKDVYGKEFDKIVIDLNTTSYVDYVLIQFSEDSFINKHVRVYESTVHAPRHCLMDETKSNPRKYTCNCPARIILLEGAGTIENMTIKSIGLKLENYVGCFDSAENGFSSKNPDDCDSKCSASAYYGIKPDGTCICIMNLYSIEEVEFILCNHACSKDPKFLCGSSDYFSVYSKDEFHKNRAVVRPLWNCIYSRVGCPRCIAGTFGFNCERTECTTSNGNCDERPCGSYLLAGTYVMYAVCMCSVESRRSSHLKCSIVTVGCTDVVCVNGECEEHSGDYKCVCKHGFHKLSKEICEDINECNLANVCPRGTTCTNSMGNYECPCKDGYARDEGKSDKSFCKDINECEFPDIFCPGNVQCVNFPGAWDCICSKGTMKVKYFMHIECEDIDECEDVDACNLTSSFCINTKSSYACACLPGFRQVNTFTCAAKKKLVKTTQDYPDEMTSVVQVAESDSSSGLFTYLLFGFLFLLVIAVIIATVFIFLRKRETRQPSMEDATSKISELY